jgi:hypothetical protein
MTQNITLINISNHNGLYITAYKINKLNHQPISSTKDGKLFIEIVVSNNRLKKPLDLKIDNLNFKFKAGVNIKSVINTINSHLRKTNSRRFVNFLNNKLVFETLLPNSNVFGIRPRTTSLIGNILDIIREFEKHRYDTNNQPDTTSKRLDMIDNSTQTDQTNSDNFTNTSARHLDQDSSEDEDNGYSIEHFANPFVNEVLRSQAQGTKALNKKNFEEFYKDLKGIQKTRFINAMNARIKLLPSHPVAASFNNDSAPLDKLFFCLNIIRQKNSSIPPFTEKDFDCNPHNQTKKLINTPFYRKGF